MKFYSLLFLLLLSFSLLAQTKILTQEEAGQRALEAYEKENPPRESIPIPAPAAFEEFFGAVLHERLVCWQPVVKSVGIRLRF